MYVAQHPRLLWMKHLLLVSTEAPKKTRKEKRQEWELLNDSQAIWLRSPKDVTDEEYKKFYKTISKVGCANDRYA